MKNKKKKKYEAFHRDWILVQNLGKNEHILLNDGQHRLGEIQGVEAIKFGPELLEKIQIHFLVHIKKGDQIYQPTPETPIIGVYYREDNSNIGDFVCRTCKKILFSSAAGLVSGQTDSTPRWMEL